MNTPEKHRELPIVVGITGASGAIYAQRLIQHLLRSGRDVHLAVSAPGRIVVKEELQREIGDPWGDVGRDGLHEYHEKDFYAPFCSGSFRFQAMVVIPASMGSVGAIASGSGVNNIHRGADVALKEKIPLVIVPRETPLSIVHLENLLRLARAGATILPPCPAFYQGPETMDDLVDFVVSRVLDSLGIDNELFQRWGRRVEP